MFIRPSLAGPPIAFQVIAKSLSGFDLPSNHRDWFVRQAAGTSLAHELLGQIEVRAMGRAAYKSVGILRNPVDFFSCHSADVNPHVLLGLVSSYYCVAVSTRFRRFPRPRANRPPLSSSSRERPTPFSDRHSWKKLAMFLGRTIFDAP